MSSKRTSHTLLPSIFLGFGIRPSATIASMRDETGHPSPGWPFAGYAVQEYWAAKHAARFWQLVKALGVADLILKLDTEHAEQIGKAAQMKRMPG